MLCGRPLSHTGCIEGHGEVLCSRRIMTNIPRLLALPLLSLASAPACQMHMVESDDSLSCEAGRCDALTFTAVGKKTLSHTTNEDETFQIGTFRQGEVVAFDLIEDDTRKWTGTVAVNFSSSRRLRMGPSCAKTGSNIIFTAAGAGFPGPLCCWICSRTLKA